MEPNKLRKSGQTNTAPKKCKICNCKQSKCLKLYCECFAGGHYCLSNCRCESCENNTWNEHKRLEAIETIVDRNKGGFRPKISTRLKKETKKSKRGNNDELSDSDHGENVKGCSCKKTSCLKKYCECFGWGVSCSEYCRCNDCKNAGPGKLALIAKEAEGSKDPGNEASQASDNAVSKGEKEELRSPNVELMAFNSLAQSSAPNAIIRKSHAEAVITEVVEKIFQGDLLTNLLKRKQSDFQGTSEAVIPNGEQNGEMGDGPPSQHGNVKKPSPEKKPISPQTLALMCHEKVAQDEQTDVNLEKRETLKEQQPIYPTQSPAVTLLQKAQEKIFLEEFTNLLSRVVTARNAINTQSTSNRITQSNGTLTQQSQQVFEMAPERIPGQPDPPHSTSQDPYVVTPPGPPQGAVSGEFFPQVHPPNLPPRHE